MPRTTPAPRRASSHPQSRTKTASAGRQRLKPDERRQQLVDATIACLAKYGAQGTGVRQICREVEVAPSLVSYFFQGGLNELLIAANRTLAERFIAALEAAARTDPGPDRRSAQARLRAIFQLYFSPEWLDDTVVGAYIALWSLSRTELDLKEAMTGLHQRQRDAVVGPLAELARERGAKVDVGLLADCLVIFLTGLWLDLGLNPDNIPPKRALRMCQAWLDGSLVRSGAKRA